MAVDSLKRLERGALGRQEAMIHPLEVFADDMQIRIRQQVVNIGDPARDRIFDRYHRQFGRAVVHSLKHVFKTRARQRLHLGIRSSAGHVRIGAGEALEGDFAVHTDRSVS